MAGDAQVDFYILGLLRVATARLVSQIEKGWWKEVPLTCYSAKMAASWVGAFVGSHDWHIFHPMIP